MLAPPGRACTAPRATPTSPVTSAPVPPATWDPVARRRWGGVRPPPNGSPRLLWPSRAPSPSPCWVPGWVWCWQLGGGGGGRRARGESGAGGDGGGGVSRPAAERLHLRSGRTSEPVRTPGLSVAGMERQLPCSSATQVGAEQRGGLRGSALRSRRSAFCPPSRSEDAVTDPPTRLGFFFWGGGVGWGGDRGGVAVLGRFPHKALCEALAGAAVPPLRCCRLAGCSGGVGGLQAECRTTTGKIGGQ